MVGKLQRVPLRAVWRHEARHFTTWLEENIDVLNDVLDISLVNVEREKPAGVFKVDLVAEDNSGRPVVIENQLDRSNHDHLGKLITYFSGLDASAAIWIVADPRPEHIKAVTWLNESANAAFYLVKVEAIKIDESEAAPLLTVIVGPSEEAKEAGETKRELAERHIIRRKFWNALLEKANLRTKLHSAVSPGVENWISTGAGVSGLSYFYVTRMHDSSVELYIDRGDKDINENIFDQFFVNMEGIEESSGGTLSWERLDAKRACRIKSEIIVGGYKDEDRWAQIHDEMINQMINLERALKPHIQKLKS